MILLLSVGLWGSKGAIMKKLFSSIVLSTVAPKWARVTRTRAIISRGASGGSSESIKIQNDRGGK